MTAYIIRRILYSIPILLGVNIIVFALFFFVNTPDDMAALHLGHKRVTPEMIDKWKRAHSLDLPYFYNEGYRRFFSFTANQNTQEKEWFLPKSSSKEIEFRFTVEAPPKKKLRGKREITFTLKQANWEEFSVQPNKVRVKRDKNVVQFTIPDSIEKVEGFFRVKTYNFNARIMVRFVAEKPALLNRLVVDSKAKLSFMERFTRTIFYERSIRMLFFDFGKSDRGKDIADEISRRIMPSLYITVPTFFIGIVLAIFFAMLLAYSRGERVDKVGMFLCVVGMSISALFYIIAGQVVFGKILKLFPVSGYEPGFSAWRFVLMPVLIAVLAGLGRSIRFYRTVFLEEMNKDYVRTARAKGVRESKILFTHILKNAMIPILTGVVVELPFLITGSLLLESFFAIPGMGAYLLEAIQQQDFAVVQAMVTLGSYLYIAGLLLTDISYTFVDPRVRLQ